MKLMFALLPFFMLGGTAWQGGGFYLFTFLIPLVLLLSGNIQPDFRRWRGAVTLIAACLLMMFFLFPLTEVMGRAFFVPGEILKGSLPVPALIWSDLFRSRFSSAFCLSAIFLFAYAFLGQKQSSQRVGHKKKFTSFSAGELETIFHRFMLIATLILLSYCIWQHLSGVDLLSRNLSLGENRRIPGSALFRCSGFFGHPLSLASCSLALFSFYLVQTVGILSSARMIAGPGVAESSRSWKLSALIACLHSGLVLLSGGRFAAVVLLLIVVLVIVCYGKTSLLRSGRKMMLWTLIAFVAAGAGLSVYTGLASRFTELLDHLRTGETERLKFWEVYWAMFMDQPWLGQGFIRIQSWSRDIYYHALGYGDLEHKYNAHNIFLETIASLGLPGSVLMVMLLLILGIVLRYMAYFSGQILWFHAFCVAIVANLINGLTQNTFFDSNVSFIYIYLFWILFWICLLNRSVT